MARSAPHAAAGSVKEQSGFTPARRRLIHRRLLAWYDHHQRDLPWRQRLGDGYAQLVAEFMLQQTQVATVINYYNRFMQRFPAVAALAAADVGEVLALWSGLGYYSRARNLHAAAQKIMHCHNGSVPDTVEALIALPGVGRYTAGAIASVAYDRRAPLVDGNVARVLMRLLAIEAAPNLPAVRERLWSVAEDLLPEARCGDFNQALMELGATVCSPQTPRCLNCPLAGTCAAAQQGRTNVIPAAAPRTRVLPATMVTAALRRGDRMLLVQRPATGLWGGLWELPTEPVGPRESLDAARERLILRLPSNSRLSNRPLSPVTRLLTHRRVTFHTYEGTSKGHAPKLPSDQPAQWVIPAELSHLGISRATEAILRILRWQIKKNPARSRPVHP